MVLKDSAQEHDKDVHGFSQSKFLVVKEGLEREVDVEPAKPSFPGGKQVKHIVSGGVAGALSRTCVSPLERVKILLQVGFNSPQRDGFE